MNIKGVPSKHSIGASTAWKSIALFHPVYKRLLLLRRSSLFTTRLPRQEPSQIEVLNLRSSTLSTTKSALLDLFHFLLRLVVHCAQ
jgi:hypothetical protein